MPLPDDPNDKPGYLVIPLPYDSTGAQQTAALQNAEHSGYRLVDGGIFSECGSTFAVMSRGYK